MFKNSNSIPQKEHQCHVQANINAIKKMFGHKQKNPPDTFISNQQQHTNSKYISQQMLPKRDDDDNAHNQNT